MIVLQPRDDWSNPSGFETQVSFKGAAPNWLKG